jgi:hypothetical protein
MRHSKHDDANLSEVKAVLDRLQRISRKPNAAGAQTAEDDAALTRSPQPAEPASVEDGGASPPIWTASPIPQVNAPRLVKAAVLVVGLLAVFVGIGIFIGIERQPASVEVPPPGAAPQNPVPASAQAQEAQKSQAAAALHVASELMASGQVQAARDVLLRATQGGSADVAWALARSYDPNFLVTVPAADAGPNVTEATRWYRSWYEIAVRQGLVADSVSLDRIIRSMN